MGIDVGGAKGILIGSPEGETEGKAEGLLTLASSINLVAEQFKLFWPVRDPPRPQAEGSKILECCPLQAPKRLRLLLLLLLWLLIEPLSGSDLCTISYFFDLLLCLRRRVFFASLATLRDVHALARNLNRGSASVVTIGGRGWIIGETEPSRVPY